jgi:phospholipid/cholesterol/gamma-HCH transport system substrate-binding protein
MLSRFVRIQLTVFGVVALLAVGYASFAYVGLPRLLGFGQYPVVLELPRTGGLYPGAQVTLRGATIGRVAGIRLTDTGAAADLSLDSGVALPADVTAAVRNTSAIGEQYVELTPTGNGGRDLAAGDVVPADRVSLPTEINDVLDSTNRLVRSVPQPALRTSIDEFYDAFANTGDDLQLLLGSSQRLLVDAQVDLGPTTALIDDLQPVLATQVRRSGEIRSFLSDLAGFTGQIRSDDEALRGVLDATPGFAGELSSLFDQMRPTVPVLLANLTAVGQVLEVYRPNVEHTLVVLPATVNNVQTITTRNRGVPESATLDLKLSINDPPACTVGFTAATRDPADLSPIPPVPDTYCKAPLDSETLVRGARQSPCPNDPARRSPDAAGCGLDFQTPQEAAAAAAAGRYDPRAETDRDAAIVPEGVPYDRVTGLSFGPDGDAFSLGDATRNGTVPTTWKAFFLDPLQIPT